MIVNRYQLLFMLFGFPGLTSGSDCFKLGLFQTWIVSNWDYKLGLIIIIISSAIQKNAR